MSDLAKLTTTALKGRMRGVLLAFLLCAARGWDEKVSDVNVGGVMEDPQLGASQGTAVETVSKLRERTAEGGCSAIMSKPAKDPEWRKQIEKELATDLHDRVKEQGEEGAAAFVPRINVRLKGIQEDVEIAKKRIAELKKKINSDPGIKLAKGFKTAQSAVKAKESIIEKLQMEIIKAQGTHDKMTKKYQAAEKVLFKLRGGGWNNHTKKWGDIKKQRDTMAKAQNSTVAQDKIIGKLQEKMTREETALSSAKDKLNEAHYHNWKPAFYNNKISQVEAHLKQLQEVEKKYQKRKTKLEKMINDVEAELPNVIESGKSAAKYEALVKVFYDRLMGVIDKAALNAVGKGEMKVDTMDGPKTIKDKNECPTADLNKVVCDYLKRKKAEDGFKGMPDGLLREVASRIPGLMGSYMSEGPLAAAKNPARFESINKAFELVFSSSERQTQFQHKAITLYSECVFMKSAKHKTPATEPKNR